MALSLLLGPRHHDAKNRGSRQSSLPRNLRVALTLSLLSASTLLFAVQSLEAQPARKSSRSAEPVSNGPVSTQFMVLQTTPSGTRLMAPDGSITVGLPDDRFASVLQLSRTDAIVAGTRATEDGQHIVLVESKLGPDGHRVQREILGPQALSRLPQSSPRLLEPANPRARLTAVWFEGNDATANEVWTADLLTDGFTRPYRIATAGPGSQVALQGVTLGNGEQLLLWSAFDGEDSEIVWVHRRPEVTAAGGWSQAQRLYPNNTVPDITPAVVAVGNQALAAWSWFDGITYRLMLSRFDGAAWSAPKAVTQGAGIFPRFQQGASQPLLSFRAATPRRWVYRQLDLGGEVVGEVLVLSEETERPTILASDAETLVLTARAAQPGTQDLAAVTSESPGTAGVGTAAESRTMGFSSTQIFSWQQP